MKRRQAALDRPAQEAPPAGPARKPAATGPPGTAETPAAAAARRTPDLSALPPILGGTGAFGSLTAALAATPGGAAPHVALTAVPHGAKSFLVAALALAAGERVCWIARDAEIGDRVAEELVAWLGDQEAVAVLEPRTALAYERSELIRDESAARIATLARWRSGRAQVLVASVQALLQATIPPSDLPSTPHTLRPGDRIRRDALLEEFLRLGYEPVLEVAGQGEMARRGGLVDVFPAGAALPVRIELFGDEVDEIRVFDPTDQRSLRPAGEIEFLPASEFLVPAEGINAVRAQLGPLVARLSERLATDLARFEGHSDARRGAAITPGTEASAPAAALPRALDVGDAAEVWAAVVCPATGLDHVSPATLLVVDEPGEVAAAAEFLWEQAGERRADLVAAGELPEDWPDAYLPPAEWKARLERSRTLELSWEPGPAEAIGGGAVFDDAFAWREPVLPPGRVAELGRAIQRWRTGGPASVPLISEEAEGQPRWGGSGAISAGQAPSPENGPAVPPRIVLTSDQAARLAELLSDARIPVGVTMSPPVPPPGAVALVGRSLNAGFGGGPDGLIVVTDRELFGSVRVRRPKALRRVVPRDILERLAPGDLVVHIDHGIARYEQMLRRGGAGEERDYLELSFAGGDRVFVPLEQIGRVSRYAGAERPSLSRLGGGEWARTKDRVRRAVADLAEDLLRLYAARQVARGHPFAPDTPWQGELEAAFPYEETADQLRAVDEVKADMEVARPMDRLVVGDVGYGKTEVALRAAFKAIQDGRQVAVLVPTTVLADQHLRTFQQRFAAFPITVRLLSRAVPPRIQTVTLAALAAGTVDLVVGTHRLLSRDVRFRDLGLLVVDEEQRFGVAAKERLKKLRTEVDVLTLSATPIPRTLNLALAGVRDMSVIETPPEDRLPIQTRVAEASAGLVKDAILRELDRGGQAFFVHNRVETIEAQADQLRRLLPAARIVVGHGQMSESTLERVMRAFAAGEADVLVCTTIIESGLDIPNANTIIIDRADALGLAQLYQLRGRVGRSSRRAYAYLLYRRRTQLSDDARRRLQAIFAASELGAGFQIALADLEIRGAGDILGAEQSGHLAAVGFDLYTRLLAEAVEERRSAHEGREPVRASPGAVVDLPVDAHLPDEYVPDEAQKLELYRRLARARAPGDVAAFRQEVIDRFGPLPPPVLRLAEVAELRIAAEAAGIASLAREEGQLVVRFAGALSRGAATRLVVGAGLPGVRPGDIVASAGQVRIRAPRDPALAWTLTQAVVARVMATREAAGETIVATREAAGETAPPAAAQASSPPGAARSGIARR
jgi:transcription-repair coupling factor (superfamily II helicase)